MLANVYLHALDRAWEERHAKLGKLTRYADDLVILLEGRVRRDGRSKLRRLLADLGLELPEQD